MKLISFTASGHSSYGAVVGDRIVDLGRRLGDRYPTLRAAIAGGALAGAAAEVDSAATDMALSQVTLLPPITDPDKIICAGRNYRAHAAEAGGAPPENPSVFLRLVNTLVAHNQPMVCPKISGDFDYEGELALIIGKPGRHIAKADALGHIFGYTCFNDGSIRDIQFKHSIAAGKNFHATGGFGPWIVTADEITDPTQLHLMTRLNGREVQHTGIDDLIFDIPTLISYCSAWTPLSAGDVIATGTPEGVGFARKPPLWMKPGDIVEVEIDGGIGVLRNPVMRIGGETPGGGAILSVGIKCQVRIRRPATSDLNSAVMLDSQRERRMVLSAMLVPVSPFRMLDVRRRPPMVHQ